MSDQPTAPTEPQPETVQPKIDTTGWPTRLLEVAEEISAESALLLVDKFAGISLYVPTKKELTRNHLLVRELGWDKAVALCEARGGEHIEIPTLYYARAKKAAIVGAVGSTRSIAMKYRVTEAYVRRLRKDLKQETQMSLL